MHKLQSLHLAYSNPPAFVNNLFIFSETGNYNISLIIEFDENETLSVQLCMELDNTCNASIRIQGLLLQILEITLDAQATINASAQ